jgi:uncharacterized protein (DUF58 family)
MTAAKPGLRERLMRSMNPPRRLRFTREGKFFTFVTFGVGVAAINTGNNLLYLVLGLLLSIIILSGVLSEIALRGLHFQRRLPKRAYAGSALLVEIEVQNNKKWAPSYSVEVEDRIEGRVTDKRCYFLKVSAGAKQTATYRRVAPLRGRERYVALRVATRFPFGLFEKWREIQLPDEHIVYPGLLPTAELQRLNAHDRGEHIARRERGRGDVDSLRELRDGEPVRDVDWKKTAARGDVVARERVREGSRVIKLELRNGPIERAKDGFATAFEEELRRVAWRTSRALQRGATVELRVQDGGHGHAALLRLVPSGEATDRGLRFLALLPPAPALVATHMEGATAAKIAEKSAPAPAHSPEKTRV